jgi:Heterokaryon incompatibility protein (HET)
VLPPLTYEFPPYDRWKPWQIRILSLQKNCSGPQISGNLKTINLTGHVRTQDHSAHGEAREAPPYHALSYTAGDLRKKVRFQCDGRIFFITSTCGKPFYGWRTLTYHAQYGSKLSVLTNETEGKRQDKFSEMAEVYRRAQRISIWLGEAHHCTLRAIIEMQRLVRALSSNNTSRSFQRDYDHYFDESDRPREKWIVWEGIADLIHRPHFGRLWVLQEAVLAKEGHFFVANILSGGTIFNN